MNHIYIFTHITGKVLGTASGKSKACVIHNELCKVYARRSIFIQLAPLNRSKYEDIIYIYPEELEEAYISLGKYTPGVIEDCISEIYGPEENLQEIL